MSYTAVHSVQTASIIKSISAGFYLNNISDQEIEVLTRFWGDRLVDVILLNLNLMEWVHSYSKSLFTPTGLCIPHNEHNLFLLTTEQLWDLYIPIRKKQCQPTDLSSAVDVGLEPLGMIAAPLLTETSGYNKKRPSRSSGRTGMFYSNKRNLSQIGSGWAIKMWL